MKSAESKENIDVLQLFNQHFESEVTTFLICRALSNEYSVSSALERTQYLAVVWRDLRTFCAGGGASGGGSAQKEATSTRRPQRNGAGSHLQGLSFSEDSGRYKAWEVTLNINGQTFFGGKFTPKDSTIQEATWTLLSSEEPRQPKPLSKIYL